MTRILVVEDQRDLALGLRANLEVEGYDVDVAETGEDALRIAGERRPDVVILDVMLPGVDGGTAIRLLKAEPGTADIPIVAMSAGRNLRKHTGELDDADGALAKPFDIDALLAQVAFHLARRRADEPPDEPPG